jgi:hypothetical protein
MTIKQLYLNGFSHLLCGSASRRSALSLQEATSTPGGLSRLAGRFFPKKLLLPALLKNAKGKDIKPRNCIYTLPVVFWAFLFQVLTRNASCAAALASIQAMRAAQRKSMPDDNTSGYCQARGKLPLAILQAIFEAVGNWIDQRCEGKLPLLNNRVVRVIDGTGISMPDSDANRAKWPYAGNQKPGCGFPMIKLVALFCLSTGRMIKFAYDSWKQSEYNLARQALEWLKKDEVLLGDCGFCSWGLVALSKNKGVDVVFRIHQMRKDKAGKSVWKKPRRPKTWSQELWDTLPEELHMRIIKFTVPVKGFRTEHITLCTTLLDTKTYPDEAIIELYMRRWRVELYYRDIKVTLGLDVLRCESPQMVEKEIWMQSLAHNMVRALMLEAALTHGVPVDRISFKGTVSRMREWAGWMNQDRVRINQTMLKELLHAIASDQVPLRPHRSEPRAVKRRRKNYQLLTKPRHEMVVSKSRRKK